MHVAIRAAGFSLMTMFVSCGVGAQDLDTRIGKIAMAGDSPTQESIARQFYRASLHTYDDDGDARAKDIREVMRGDGGNPYFR
ncbi:hypothetical protein [Pseudomonas sp. LB3P14]